MEQLLNRFVGNISPAALLVSSFFWSWLDVVVFGPTVYWAAGADMATGPMAVSFATSVVVLGAACVCASLRRVFVSVRGMAVLALVAGTSGTLLLYGCAASQLTGAALAAGALIGVFEGVGIATVGAVATCQGTTNALIHIAAALPMNIVIILLAVFLVPEASIVLIALLPLLSVLCFSVYGARQANRAAIATVLEPSRVVPRAPVRPLGVNRTFLLVVLTVTAAFGMVNAQTIEVTGNGPFDAYSGLVVRAVVSAAVLVGYVRYSWRPQSLFSAASIIMAISLIVGAVLPSSAVQLLFLAGYVCFDLLIWALIVGMNHGSGAPVLRTVCVVQAVDQLGILLGTFIPLSGSAQVVALANAALGAALMLLIMYLLLRDRSVVENMGGNDYGFGPEEEALPDAEGEEAREAFDASEPTFAVSATSLEEIAARYFLSTREVDVLGLLMAGRSGPYIADQLCISANTVKTHIRHIYTKLDVHDRQELLDLVQADPS